MPSLEYRGRVICSAARIGDAGAHDPSTAGLRAGFEASAESGHAFPHADDAEAEPFAHGAPLGDRSGICGLRRRGRTCRAGIADLDLKISAAITQPHSHLGAGARVAGTVGEGFLDDTIDRHLGDRSERARVPDRCVLDGLVESSGRFDEFRKVAEAGVAFRRCRSCAVDRTVAGRGRFVRCGGAVGRGVRIAQRIDEGAEFVDGLASRGFDDPERFFGFVGVLLETAACGCGVDADSGDVVGDPIVEFAGDAHPFEIESLPGQLLLLCTDFVIGGSEIGHESALLPCPVAEDPRSTEEGDIRQEGHPARSRELQDGEVPERPEQDSQRHREEDRHTDAQQQTRPEGHSSTALPRTDRIDSQEQDDLRDTDLHGTVDQRHRIDEADDGSALTRITAAIEQRDREKH